MPTYLSHSNHSRLKIHKNLDREAIRMSTRIGRHILGEMEFEAVIKAARERISEWFEESATSFLFASPTNQADLTPLRRAPQSSLFAASASDPSASDLLFMNAHISELVDETELLQAIVEGMLKRARSLVTFNESFASSCTAKTGAGVHSRGTAGANGAGGWPLRNPCRALVDAVCRPIRRDLPLRHKREAHVKGAGARRRFGAPPQSVSLTCVRTSSLAGRRWVWPTFEAETPSLAKKRPKEKAAKKSACGEDLTSGIHDSCVSWRNVQHARIVHKETRVMKSLSYGHVPTHRHAAPRLLLDMSSGRTPRGAKFSATSSVNCCSCSSRTALCCVTAFGGKWNKFEWKVEQALVLLLKFRAIARCPPTPRSSRCGLSGSASTSNTGREPSHGPGNSEYQVRALTACCGRWELLVTQPQVEILHVQGLPL
ncbi:hypothetical protein DFH07DRAFT_785932 [Mycena maculata]|uniref:Uncharacterized protein n=1 Tax=Mycena maculata TaxID=230809 RepID=A0AAD7H6Q1_9AGAR|nr:hypothetical protein DFH07DRAFT_785932 [Mycena maculata]